MSVYVNHSRDDADGLRPASLTVAQKHQLRIARDTLKMNDAMARVMGGMTKDEARKVIRRLTGKEPK